MNEKNFENILERKITEAKLLVAEKRLQFTITIFGGVLVLFGIILPFVQISISTDKVNQAITEMKSEVKEALGELNRIPSIICLYEGSEITNSTIIEFDTEKPKKIIELKNTGDKRTSTLKMKFYVNFDGEIFMHSDFSGQKFSDEKEYSDSFYYSGYESGIVSLEPKESNWMYISFSPRPNTNELIPVLLKIYYGQENPTEYRFNIKFK